MSGMSGESPVILIKNSSAQYYITVQQLSRDLYLPYTKNALRHACLRAESL